jgi:tryptophanyl-tRNA synthetase
MSDTADTAKKKIMSATTDSLEDVQYDYTTRPGISNLLDIYKLLGGNSQEFIGHKQYGPLKSAVAEKMTHFLDEFNARLENVDVHEINQKLSDSETEMNTQANARLQTIQKAVGLR